jgi:superfamily II DNA or RNA helicase
LQLQVEDVIKDHKVRLVVYKAIGRVAKAPHRIEDVRVIPVLVVWQEALLHALLVKAPLLLLQNRYQRQVEILLFDEVHNVKASRSLGDGVQNLFIVEVGILQEPKRQVLPEFEGDSQGS